MNKFWFFNSCSCILFNISYQFIIFFVPCKDLPSPLRSTTTCFFAWKDFYSNPHVNIMLLSYVEVQVIVMFVIDSPYPSSKTSNIDLVILAYINVMASYAYILVSHFLFELRGVIHCGTLKVK